MKKSLNLTRLTIYTTLLLAIVSLTACAQEEEKHDKTGNSSPELCGNQNEGKQDFRCHSKPASFGAAFIMSEIKIPTDPLYTCPKDVCPQVTDKNGQKSDQKFQNEGGKFLTQFPGLDLANKLAEQVKNGTTKIVFELDGISPKAKSLPVGQPFKIYVWAYNDKDKKFVSDSIDAGYSSKSFFPNATIDANGVLKTGEGTIILPVEKKSASYHIKGVLQVQNAVLQAKVVKGKGKNPFTIEKTIIHGGLLKSSMLDIIHKVEESCNITNNSCVTVSEGKCTPAPAPRSCGTMSFCKLVPDLVCSHEEGFLPNDIFTEPLAKTPEGKDVPNAAAPSVIEVKQITPIELKAEMFPK